MRAAAENAAFQLTYSQGANAYTIQQGSKILATKPIAEGTSITKDGVITFSPRGTAGANRVRLRNKDGICKQVIVSATGRVRVCSPTSCAEDC
jgi:Tfp pilus assembly protein FimT